MTPNRVSSGNFGFELAERHSIALEELVEQEPPSGVGQGLEHQVLAVHTVSISDSIVTCQ